jgi:hypothetical protein
VVVGVMCYLCLSHLVVVGWLVGVLGLLLNLKAH